jgi:anti-sigma factor RsiW
MKTGAKKGSSDMDLMLYADGELSADEAREVAARLTDDPSARGKVDSLRQVGEAVRTYVELETDRAEVEMPAFADMWQRIERRIQANGRAPEPAEPSRAGSPARRPARAPVAGWWASIRRWLEDHRGHVLTGAISAGAACAVMLALGPRDERVVERVRGGVQHGTPVALRSQPPEVEDLEVYEGSGTILTIEPDGEGDSAAAVIWISDDHEKNKEGPL